MATWHQRQAAAPLQHPTRWRLINDAPNKPMSAFVFDTEAAALAQQKRTGGHLLPPATHRGSGQSTGD